MHELSLHDCNIRPHILQIAQTPTGLSRDILLQKFLRFTKYARLQWPATVNVPSYAALNQAVGRVLVKPIYNYVLPRR
jgi:hypothetical protein